MDIATIVGLLAAFGLIFMAISENAPAFVDTASLLIVVAGSIAVVMARCSLGEFLGAMGVMGKAFSRKIDDPVELITQIVELANIARKDGMIALEGQDIANPFLAKAVSMLVDGTDGEIIKSSLNRDNDMMYGVRFPLTIECVRGYDMVRRYDDMMVRYDGVTIS